MRAPADAGMGILRIALLFGSAAVALALIAAPIARQPDAIAVQPATVFAGVDMMSTGSIGHRDTYTLRSSVLQPSPSSVCVIRANGTRSGDC